MAAAKTILPQVIDLRSDTVTKPTPEMRKAMFEAVVGDDVLLEDPTVNELEDKIAKMCGKESSLYVPTATMSNLIAIMVHCNHRGAEVIVGELSHMFLYEQGGAAQIAGTMLCTIPNQRDGTFDLDVMESKVRGSDIHEPITSLICVENTHNTCGGNVLPLEWLDDLAERASRLKIPLHLDGSRIFNASVYLKLPVAQLVKHFSSISICLSKGLGAPAGALLIGKKEFIETARRVRKVLGGGMRQVGVLAATGIVALDHMVERLGEDHRRAATIAKAINNLRSPNFWVDMEYLHTNILFIKMNKKVIKAEEFCNRLDTVNEEEILHFGGNPITIKCYPLFADSIRLVTYHEITDKDVDLAIKKLEYIIKDIDGKK